MNEIKSKSGISWGVKIIIINAAFILLIFGLVYYSTTVEVNLVSDNYYEKELKHQTQIDKTERADNLNEQVKITIADGFIKVIFPNLGDKNLFGGQITCYRPSDYRKDIKIPVSLSDTFEQLIPVDNFEKGLWKIKIDWYFGKTTYFNEKPLMVE